MIALARSRAVAVAGFLFVVAGCGGSTGRPTTAAELPPADPEAVRQFVAGVRAMQQPGAGSARRAQTAFQRAVQLDPNLWEAHYDLGIVQLRAGRLEEAAASLQAARRIQPSAPEPARALATVERARGDLDEAISLMQTAVEQDPADLEARVILAQLLREGRRFPRALAQAREVLIREPTNVRALLEVGRVYRARGQMDVAFLVFQKALALTTDAQPRLRAEIHNEMGLLELARGDTQAAFTELAAAIGVDPTFTPARLNQGAVLLSAGDYDGAVTEYQAVLAQDPADLDAKVALGAALRGQGNPRLARRTYREVLAVDPNHLGALFNVGVLEAEFLNERPRARTRFVRFLELAPRDHPKRAMAEQYLLDIPAPAGASGGHP